jgi:hypothetical protein
LLAAAFGSLFTWLQATFKTTFVTPLAAFENLLNQKDMRKIRRISENFHRGAKEKFIYFQDKKDNT